MTSLVIECIKDLFKNYGINYQANQSVSVEVSPHGGIPRVRPASVEHRKDLP